jgi:hypothetical protein
MRLSEQATDAQNLLLTPPGTLCSVKVWFAYSRFQVARADMTEPDSPPWDSEEFRHALANKQPGHAFALVRKAKGLTQVDFGVLMYWDRSQAGRIERDEIDTIRDIYLMGQTADALGIPRLALLPALLGTADTGTIEVKDNEGVEPVDRRKFGQTGLILLGTAVAATSAGNAPLIGADHLRAMSDAADQLWAHDSQCGSGGLLEPALQQYTAARRLLDHGSYSARTGSDLAVAVGNLADCAGWLACDSGNHHAARRCFTEALVLTERIENGGAGINEKLLWQNVMDDLRQQAWRDGNMREGLQLSRRVAEASRHIPSARLQALNAGRLAVAYAAIGESRDAETSIRHAWRELDRGLDNSDDPIWLHFVTESEIQSIEAKARTYLGEHGQPGQHAQAVEIYRRSVGAGDSKSRDEASYRAYFAASIARLGDTKTAITEGLTALSFLEGPVTSPRLVAELQPVRTAATKTRHDDAAEFRSRFDALTIAV